MLPYPKMKTIMNFIGNLFSQSILHSLVIKFQLQIIHIISTIVTKKMDSFDETKKMAIVEITLNIMAKYAETYIDYVTILRESPSLVGFTRFSHFLLFTCSFSHLWKNNIQHADSQVQTDSANFGIKLLIEILPLCTIAKNDGFLLKGLVTIGTLRI